MRPIIIAAGGTGGHFFPAESLAAALIARGHRVVLMTDARSGALKSPVFAGREQYVLPGAGIAGRGAIKAARALLALAHGTIKAVFLFRDLDPAVVVGFGGYPSVPPILAAIPRKNQTSIVLHEQNAVLGRANRLLSRFANVLALGMPKTTRIPAGGKFETRVTGNPVRPPIAAIGTEIYMPPQNTIELLVVGGSLGAKIFSDVVPQAVAELPGDLRIKLKVTQQCRVEDLVRVRGIYKSCGVPADLAPFFTDIADRLARAHLVIGRAGASTIAELAVAGRPSIVVPLPSAIDDHQTANAQALADAGATTVIAQKDFTPQILCEKLTATLRDNAALTHAATQARLCGRASSAGDLADVIEQLMNTKARVA